MMDFIKEIHESKMIKDSLNQRSLTYSDCCERMYLILLSMELMKHYPRYSSFVHRYASKTKHHNYKPFRPSGTDLYNYIHFVQGDEETISKLKDPGAARRQQGLSAFPAREVIQYIARMSVGTPSSTQQMFIRIENGLNINNKDYSELRRYIGRYNKESKEAQKNIATKLLYALRSKLRNSDIIDDFSKLVADNDLESSRVTDTEPTQSTPDITTTPKEFMLYRRLGVEGNKLGQLMMFLRHAREGKSIPSYLVSSYHPLFEIISDIIDAGPAEVQLLKNLHKRAIKSKNG